MNHNSGIPPDLATSLTNSLLNQPMPLQFQHHNQASSTEVRSRKENRLHQPINVPLGSSAPPAPDHKEMRRVSQQMYMPSGSFVPTSLVEQHIKSPRTTSSE